jgi:hypothetical protein
MNALAVIYVNDHLQMLDAEARHARLASLVGRRTLRERLGSALSSVRGILGGDSNSSTVPKLSNYPFGG